MNYPYLHVALDPNKFYDLVITFPQPSNRMVPLDYLNTLVSYLVARCGTQSAITRSLRKS